MEKHFEVSYETLSSNFSDVLYRRIVQSCQMRIVAVEASKAARASACRIHNDTIGAIPSFRFHNEAGLVRVA